MIWLFIEVNMKKYVFHLFFLLTLFVMVLCSSISVFAQEADDPLSIIRAAEEDVIDRLRESDYYKGLAGMLKVDLPADPEITEGNIVDAAISDMIAKFTAGGSYGVAQALSTEPKEEVAVDENDPVKSIEAEMIARLNAAEYFSLAKALMDKEAVEAEIIPTKDPEHIVSKYLDDPKDYPDGAVLQPDGTYRGLHAKFFNSYSYVLGGDENGITKEFQTGYIPNQRFNLDVVFENDGSTPWPKRIECRHVSNVGEYTGHTESAYVDRINNPVMPGDKCGFSFSAHGSENIGFTTFYYKLYDADSGSAIEGGDGYFSYDAHP